MFLKTLEKCTCAQSAVITRQNAKEDVSEVQVKQLRFGKKRTLEKRLSDLCIQIDYKPFSEDHQR